MTVKEGIFGDASSFSERYIPDYQRLTDMVQSLRNLGTTIALTQGSFDLVHQGHAAYLEKAKSFAGLLIVGVDSDEKIRQRKGPDRPVVPEEERLSTLTHFRGVDIVTLKAANAPKWELIKAVKPDVLVATIETYTPEEIQELEGGFCGRVEVLERMAPNSTTARIRLLQFGLADKVTQALVDVLPEVVRSTVNREVGRDE